MVVAAAVDLAELSARTFWNFPCELSSLPTSESADAPQSSRELNGVSERPMIIGMPTTSRSQQHYDYRLRDLVERTGDVTLATDLGVPRSTAREARLATSTAPGASGQAQGGAAHDRG
jgi:hypothetical protein